MVYLWYGIFYSFLGWGLEKAFAAATRSKHRLRRCFVFLPLCPVYGLGMLAVLALGTEHVPSLWARVLLGAFAATVVEYAVHAAYERLFAVRFWDYSATKCDVNGRICLPFSLCWGVLTLLAVALFISGQTLGGIVFLVLAFLISPYGIPAIAEWLVDKLHNLNFALRGFITG